MRFRSLIVSAAFTAAFVLSANAQQTPPPPPEDEIIRISSELVLIDALVVDGDNNQVKDLTADDFEIYQDGKRQVITSFSYVDGKERRVVRPEGKEGKKALPAPPISVRSDGFGRIVTFVIDDGNCLATIEGIGNARDGVKRFVQEKMRPDDKVAIYRTRGGSSLLQMYTSNKEVLMRSLRKINWAPTRCSSAFDPAEDKSTMKTRDGAASFETEADRETRKAISDNERDNQVIGSMGVLGFVVDRLRSLPQRKLVFFVSEGISTDFKSRSFDALRLIADKASRASVSVYTIAAKGLYNPDFISAQDEVLPREVAETELTDRLRNDRMAEDRSLNEGMAYLSSATGGRFIRNRNDLDDAVERVLEIETGYYLLGYEPAEETFRGAKYHDINIKLNRPGLTVTSRKGFIGRNDAESRPALKREASEIYRAIASPFTENTIDVRLTPLVKNDPNGGVVRALFHLEGSQLSFKSEPDGMSKCVINVVFVVLDEKGKVIEELNRSYPIRVPANAVDVLKLNGLEYSTDIAISKPGFYSLRLAVQDDNSKFLGTAGDYVEIRRPSKAGFFIDSLVATAVADGDLPIIPKQRPVNAAFAPVFRSDLASIRRYRAGQALAYSFDIYNAKTAKDGKPDLASRVLVYKDGALVRELPETPLELSGTANGARIEDYGFLMLNPQIEPGEYILQLVVTDRAARRSSSQWIDFEVID